MPGILVLAVLMPWVLGSDMLVSEVIVPEIFVLGLLLLTKSIDRIRGNIGRSRGK